MTAIEQIYRYDAASALVETSNGQTLALVSDQVASTRFLEARALSPVITARALRAISEIVGSRFYVHPSMLAKILREADPVATVSPGAVRFEGFSACCSAYMRLDMDDAALDVTYRQNGTTNVDFGAELRGALASVSAENELDLTIGADAVSIARDGQAIVEKKVPLPLRWIKGFAEVQVAMADMKPAFSLSKIGMQKLLRAFPRGKADHQQWVSLHGAGTRITVRETKGAVPLRGSQRLNVLDTLCGFCKGAEVYLNPMTGASAWVLDFGTQRLSLVLNAEPWRGFSGDGGVLTQIANSNGRASAVLRAQLNWQDRIDIGTLAQATGLGDDDVHGGLTELAAAGLVGFDLKHQAFFHRVLPFDSQQIAALNPRLKAAQALLDKGAIRPLGDGAEVTSGSTIHRVSIQGDQYRCTCPWYAKNDTRRGPCKHVLAVEMFQEKTT